MDNALNLDKVTPEQFAIKRFSVIDQIISKRYIIDHHHSKRKCFSPTSSDLAGYYDRIIYTVAALVLLRVGIPHSKINCMFLLSKGWYIELERCTEVAILETGLTTYKVFYKETRVAPQYECWSVRLFLKFFINMDLLCKFAAAFLKRVFKLVGFLM